MYDGHSCPSVGQKMPIKSESLEHESRVYRWEVFGEDSDMYVQGTKSHSTQRVKLQEIALTSSTPASSRHPYRRGWQRR